MFPVCVTMASATGELGTVKLSHCLLSAGKQPSCLAAGDNEMEAKVWKGGQRGTKEDKYA